MMGYDYTDTNSVMFEVNTDLYKMGLSFIESAMLCKLAYMVKTNEWTNLFLKTKTLQTWFNLSKSSVLRCLSKMEKMGLITIKLTNKENNNHKRFIWIEEKTYNILGLNEKVKIKPKTDIIKSSNPLDYLYK